VTDTSWLPIQYREFYDIPRAFVVDYRESSFFFECPFDDELDDYPDFFAVFRLPKEVRDQIDNLSWAELSARLERIGAIHADKVEFDQSKRRFVSDRVFELLGLA
jgi:hypothetical protein